MHFLIFYRLSDLALRFFYIPANSVPSEQAFSVQNYLHYSKRNRLTSERSAKLQFIYINKLTLRYKYPGKKREEQTWLTLTEDQELAIEETNMAEDFTKDEEDEVEEENREVENKSGISWGEWYKDGNDGDMEELNLFLYSLLNSEMWLHDIPLVSGSSFSLTYFLSNCTRATIYS